MNKPLDPTLMQPLPADQAHRQWENDYRQTIGQDRDVTNVSGIAIQPLYTERDWARYGADNPLGYPGQADYTRGIYATMHRGRTWTQRQLVGLGIMRYGIRSEPLRSMPVDTLVDAIGPTLQRYLVGDIG